ncbi:MAG: TPR repeat-containing protein [Parcubacteria group bacterium Licking1014_1]|nr:MAG: TPR repeat-containing protein [Parcubacteria group bacterium Licking1014_1]
MINQTKKNDLLKTFLILLILISFVVFLYGPIFKIKFGGGDNLEWYQETQERNTFSKIFDFKYSSGRLGPSAYFNPVQLIIWQYMSTNYGQQPYPYHFLSILIHLVNVLIVFFLVNKFIKNKFFSFLAALSFGIYYLNFQTVGWIAAAITTGLTAFFMLAAFLLAIKYFQTKNIFFYFSSLLIFFLGTLAKETVIFTIPILLAYYLLFNREKTLKFAKNDRVILPYFILSLPIILITFARLNSSALINVWGGFNFGIHMFYRFLDFLGHLITVAPASFNIQMAAAALVLFFFPVLIYFGLKDKKLLFLVFWLFLSISIYIYSNFRDIYSLGRYLYLPSIAWFALLYYIVANIKNLKIKMLSSFFLINYTIILNLLLILIKR